MPAGRLQLQSLLLIAVLLCLHHHHISATPSEAAVLAQVKDMWKGAPSVVKLWVEAVDACHGPWPGIGCALTDNNNPTAQTPCSILSSNCTVISLKIPNGNLTGEIPLILAGLSNLQHLDLRGNLLRGRVTPELLDSFPKLSFLDLSLNYFTGTIPNSTFEYDAWTKNCFSSSSSCHLAAQMRSIAECKHQTSLELQPCVPWTRTHLLLLIVLVLVCPVVVIGIVSAIAIYYWRSRSLQAAHFWQLKSSMRAVDVEDLQPTSSICRQFSYQELNAATTGFHQNALLGRGATGFVYQGKLDEGSKVAVKLLNTRNSSMLINEEFWNEVKERGAIQHPNVVTLRGFCKGVGGSDPMLVCEFMPNGSVLDALLRDDTPLRWPRRYSIAHGAALGLEYLHEHRTPAIIHGNLKPSNILLDRDYTARVGHFGSVRVANVSQRAVVSTLGFVDPEYGVTGKLTEKSDVFSYGMLLLLLVSGRRMLESPPSGKPQLLHWMQLLATAELSELVDPRLEGNYDKHEVSLCAQIVLLCTRIQPELRPSMSEVRRILEGTMQVPISGSLVNTPITSSHTSFVSLSHFSGSFYGTSGSL